MWRRRLANRCMRHFVLEEHENGLTGRNKSKSSSSIDNTSGRREDTSASRTEGNALVYANELTRRGGRGNRAVVVER